MDEEFLLCPWYYTASRDATFVVETFVVDNLADMLDNDNHRIIGELFDSYFNFAPPIVRDGHDPWC